MDNELAKISATLSVYLEPDIFVPEFREGFKKGNNFDFKKVKKYNQLLLSISWFVKKVSKYQIYFQKFYPNTKEIHDFEALEHHIHAYLEDSATVKNKLSEYIGALKNDISQVAINKDEIKKKLDFLNSQVHKAFESPLGLRRQHRHNGYKFVDGNLVDAEMAEMMLGEKSPFKGMMTEYAIEKFTHQRKDSFEKAKNFWLENARKNDSQVKGVANEIVEKTKDFLFKLLDIVPSDFPLPTQEVKN